MSQKKASGGWGSLLSGAVANLESRLDTILADDAEASARERAAEKAAKEAKEAAKNRPRTNSGNLAAPAAASPRGSRDASRTRGTDRLAERLAKATAQKTAGSQVPSRVATPANDAASARDSGESARSGADIPRSVPDDVKTEETEKLAEDTTASSTSEEKGTLLTSGLPINPARMSIDSSAQPSIDMTPDSLSSARASLDAPNGSSLYSKSAAELEIEMAEIREDHAHAEKQRQEEMLVYMEKIDALQAKLSYLAKETLAAAKEANASAPTGSDETKLAEKDEQIVTLMQEGEKLSKTELKHLQTIKKLRAKTAEADKSGKELQRKLDLLQRAESDLKQKVRKSEAAERQANDKVKQIVGIEKQVEDLRVDRENAAELVQSLTTQLKDAKERADRAEKDASARAAEVDKGKLAALQNELEDAQIEKKLAEDRGAAEVLRVRAEADRQKERFGVTEMELKSEISGLESKLETVRSRAEEASSAGTTGEGSNVKLMRQVETLQSQYALAKENWETIEGSLNARVSILEKERDETAKRETEVRKKARELGVRNRKLGDELESTTEQVRALSSEAQSSGEEVKLLRPKLEQAESALSDAKTEFDRQRKAWEMETSQRIDEEKLRWQRGLPSPSLRQDSTTMASRKVSAAELVSNMPSRRPLNRLTSHDLSALHAHAERPYSRRSSAMPTAATPFSRAPVDRSSDNSPSLSRQESSYSSHPPSLPPTPSIDNEADFEHNSESPQRTINDLVSTSTAGAGPSVQLVERLSLAVRRLESEKATFRDELTRLSGQRDDARNEVVALMREADTKRQSDEKVALLRQELSELRQRYDASLEMLGEREEQVQDLQGDVGEMKRIYRELVENKVGPNQA